MNNQENQAVDIDVFATLKVLWKRKFSIILVALVFAIAAFGYSAFLAKKEYQSTSRIYVVSRQNQDNNALTNSDLQAGSYLVKDYREIILSQNVLSQAIEELKLDMTPAELSKKISVSVPTDTRILSITAKDGDPKEAARIANGLRNVAAEKIISVTKVSDVTTLDEAEVPQSPSSPNIRRNVLLGFIAGAGLMVVLMVVVEVLDDRVKRPEDIEELMGLTLLGIVPDIKTGDRMNTLEISKNKLQEIRKAEEYFNALATNIQLSGVDLKVIAISSVQENEGKSTTSTNLAVAFARAGYKTLLVDCDIRNSVMTGVFRSRDKIQGLTDFLSGRSQLDQILYATDFPNLDIIESGQVAPNPTGLLQSKNFTVMMDALREHFDYIIVDTPPIGVVIDAAIIAQRCDGTVLITESGANGRKAVQKAKDQLEQTGTPFLGVVLNKFNIKAAEYGSYGGYGSYGEYGKK